MAGRTQAAARTQRVAQEEVARSQAQISAAIRDAPAGIAIFDKDMRYLAASRGYAEDYGRAGEPFVGRSHYDIFPDIPEHWREERHGTTSVRGLPPRRHPVRVHG